MRQTSSHTMRKSPTITLQNLKAAVCALATCLSETGLQLSTDNSSFCFAVRTKRLVFLCRLLAVSTKSVHAAWKQSTSNKGCMSSAAFSYQGTFVCSTVWGSKRGLKSGCQVKHRSWSSMSSGSPALCSHLYRSLCLFRRLWTKAKLLTLTKVVRSYQSGLL